MSKLVSISQWKRNHIVKKEGKEFYIFYCGRHIFKENCENVINERDTCASCFTLSNNGPICSSREDEVGVKSIVRCPREVSETGLIKIVGDQTQCKPNTLQPGASDWDYLAVFYDPDYPNESHPYFSVTKEEIKTWEELYK